MALVLPEDNGDPIREEFLLGPVDRLGGLVVPAFYFFILPINNLHWSPGLSQVGAAPFTPYFSFIKSSPFQGFYNYESTFTGFYLKHS